MADTSVKPATFAACLRNQTQLGMLTKEQQDELIGEYETAYNTALEQTGSAAEAQLYATRSMIEAGEISASKRRRLQLQSDQMAFLRADAKAKLKADTEWWDGLSAPRRAALRATGMKAPEHGKLYRDLLEKTYSRQQQTMMEYNNFLFDAMGTMTEKQIGKLARDPEQMQEVLRGLIDGEGKGEAGLMAKAFRETHEAQQAGFRKAGGEMGTITNYAPQNIHNGRAMLQLGESATVAAMKRAFDRTAMINRKTGRSFAEGSDADWEATLSHMARNIMTEGRYAAEKGLDQGKLPGSDKAAVYTASERFVVFKDADAFLEYNDKLGRGNDNLMHLLMGNIESMSRDIGLMQRMGPMAENTHKVMMASHSNERRALTDGMYTTVASRQQYMAESPFFEGVATAQALLRASLLGKAAVSSLPDMLMPSFGAKLAGIEQTFQLGTWAKNLAKSERKMAYNNARAITDTINGNLASTARYGLESNFGGKANKNAQGMSNFVMRYTGLHRMTTATQDSATMALTGDLGLAVHTQRKWADTNPDMRASAEFWGISEKEWDNVLLKSPLVKRGDDSAFLDYTKINNTELRHKLGDWDAHLRTAWSNTPDLRLRTISAGSGMGMGTGGMNTASKALASSMFMFKSYPIMVVRNFTLPMIRNLILNPGGSNMAWLATYATTMTVLGGVALQLKNLTAGNDTEDMNTNDFMFRAMLQGGTMGMVGDLFKEREYGDSLVRDLVGPMGSLLEDTWKVGGSALALATFQEHTLGREVGTFVNRYTPLSNMWMTQAAMDRIMFDTLTEAIDPTFRERHRNRESAQMKERGMTSFSPRSERGEETGPLTLPF